MHSSFIKFLFLYILVFANTTVIAQPKSMQAHKLSTPIKLDGKIDEIGWQHVPVMNNFVVNTPQFGATPTANTEARIAYDNDAIYVAVKAYDSPENIRKQFTARDRESRQDCDYISIILDTYNDKQNAFQFIVTTANVQSDVRVSNTLTSNNGGFDYNWDAVWDSRVHFDNDGWSVEIKIPYMSIRFAKNDVQSWGLNIGRFIRRKNEMSYWNPVNPQVAGLVNQNGLLMNLQQLEPPLRLSFLPYISSGYSMVPTANGQSNTFLRNGGMDVKYGINQSFTMDMTLIPDFGQTQSDNVVLNLSPFEIQFAENRPFFTEGTELFNKAGIFYSRRIGRRPGGYEAAHQLATDSGYLLLKNPSQTQLYNATKFSGRTNKNLGIGFFNAVTAPMYAEMQTQKGDILHYQTEAGANYNIVVIDQVLKNRSSISFTNTNVYRGIGERNANVAAIDINLYDRENKYYFKAAGRLSNVWGSNDHNGFKSNIAFSKVSGNWQWGVSNNIESKHYDPNDLGYLQSPNEFTTAAYISFNQFTPNKHFNFRTYEISVTHRNLYAPFAFSDLQFRGSFLHVFKNFWDIRFITDGSPIIQHDYFELRTEGRKFNRVPWQYLGIYGSTDSRKKLYISYGGGYAFAYGYNLPYHNYSFGARYRFNNKLSIQLDNNFEKDMGEFGWVFNDANTNEPVIGKRVATKVTSIATAGYNFKSRMNLTFRARHYWSKIRYKDFYNVDEKGSWEPYLRPFEDGYDRNYNAFNIDAFYTWDFMLGSRLIVAWKNALGPDVAINGQQFSKYLNNLGQTLTSPHSNEISVKFVYFIDYNTLRKKRSV